MPEESSPPVVRKNLVGQECPLNVVYAKLELAKLGNGQLLELILAESALSNVSTSLQRAGYLLLGKNRLEDGSWSLLIRK